MREARSELAKVEAEMAAAFVQGDRERARELRERRDAIVLALVGAEALRRIGRAVDEAVEAGDGE